jgi:hypothetical protein
MVPTRQHRLHCKYHKKNVKKRQIFLRVPQIHPTGIRLRVDFPPVVSLDAAPALPRHQIQRYCIGYVCCTGIQNFTDIVVYVWEEEGIDQRVCYCQ